MKSVLAETDLSKRAFCLTLFFAGCRVSEALALKWEQVDFSERNIVLETLKQRRTGVFRVISMPKHVFEGYRRLSSHSNHLWSFSRSTGWRTVKKHMEAAGIKGTKACPRGLRHSYAVSYITNDVPITTVQKWLGHKHLETTAIYLNIVCEEERNLASKIW